MNKMKWVPGLLLSVILMLTACTSVKEENNTDGSNDEAATISFIHWRGEDKNVFDNLIKKFEDENPGIKVKMNIYPSEQYQSTAQVKLLDGSTGDVFTSFPGAQFEAIAKAELYADLTNEPFVANYNNNLITAGQKDGQQLALPSQLVYNMPIYNVSMFEKNGWEVPNDWNGFLALMEQIKAAGIIPIAFPGADVGPGQFMNTMMMNNAPDETIIADLEAGKTKLTDEWWTNTLAQFKELNDKGYLQKDSLGSKKDAALALFAQEKAAMLTTGSFDISVVKQQNPNMKMQVLAPITVEAGQAEWEGIHTATFMYGINANTRYPEQAKKFLAFLSRKDIATQYANETSQFVTVKDVEYTNEDLNQLNDWLTKKTRFQPRYLIVNAEIQKAVTNSIQAVIAGNSVQDAANEAQAIVDQQLKN